MRRFSLSAVAMLIMGMLIVVQAGPAAATTTITSPGSDYFQLPGGTTPALVDVVSTGWTDGQSVSITQCDGKDPSDNTWSVAADCDFGLSPGPVTASGSTATFDGGDPLTTGHSFQPFHLATEAQGKFNCLAPGEASPANGKPDWHICRIMVTSNNTTSTSDQTFRTILFGPPVTPDVPNTVSAIAQAAGSLTVSFVEPFDGGSPITNFHVVCTGTGATTGTHDGTATTQVVTGLSAGKAYTCTVTATNTTPGTTSAASSPSNSATTWSVPGAPTAVVAKSASTTTTTGSLTVTFKQPVNVGGTPITNNTATCTSPGQTTRTGTHNGSPITVTTATTGKPYTCTVKATNSVGTGVASAAAAAVIVGSPAPPLTVTAKSGSTTTATGPLTVTFTLAAGAAGNNGSAIQSQTATCTATGGVTKTGTHTGATAAPIALTGLTTGKNYTCKVTVKNARGVGLATAALPVIEGSPAPPTGVTAAHVGATGSGQIKVHFVIGANNGNAITSQTATCTSTNGGVTKTGTHTGAAAADITVTMLSPGGVYKCTVFAHNARGNGLASAPSGSATA